MESEDDKRKALEEETKRRQIAANKEKVAKLVDLVKDSGNPPSPSSVSASERESLNEYGEADSYEYEYQHQHQPRSIDDRKFDEMFGSSRSGLESGGRRSPKRRRG